MLDFTQIDSAEFGLNVVAFQVGLDFIDDDGNFSFVLEAGRKSELILQLNRINKTIN